jgi:hypothetical protein
MLSIQAIRPCQEKQLRFHYHNNANLNAKVTDVTSEASVFCKNRANNFQNENKIK